MSADCCPLEACYETAEFCVVRFVRAGFRRKPGNHRCSECYRDIVLGERHELSKGLQDGSVWTARTCEVCAEIREHFTCDGPTYGGGLWDQLEENFIPEMRAGGPCLEGLSAKAKEALFERKRIQMGVE